MYLQCVLIDPVTFKHLVYSYFILAKSGNTSIFVTFVNNFTMISFILQDFVQQRQLLVLVIALNLSLAGMFFNLLS